MAIIDAHQHFWHFQPERDSWITEDMGVLRRDYLPADLEPELNRNRVSGCIAVQADQSERETEFLLEQAESHAFVAGVVGWVDLCADDVAEKVAVWAEHEHLCGFRHIVQAEPDVNFLLREDFQRGIRALTVQGFTYDILVFPHQLGAVLEFVRRHPEQAFVIDHLAKPCIADGFIDGWRVLIREIGSSENVYCKISGMVTEAQWDNWSYADFRPYLEIVLEAFGPRRIMYGSDWPVCRLAATYGEVLDLAKEFATQLSQDEQEDFFYRNAVSFYDIQTA